MITVRRATEEDAPWMLLQAKEFFKYHPAGITYEPVHVMNVILDFIDDGVTFVAEQDGVRLGAIGGAVLPNIFDPTYTVLTEHYLWVEKKYRKTRAMHHLIKAFTEAGEGVSAIALGYTLRSPSLGRVYERYGYKMMESTCIKEA